PRSGPGAAVRAGADPAKYVRGAGDQPPARRSGWSQTRTPAPVVSGPNSVAPAPHGLRRRVTAAACAETARSTAARDRSSVPSPGAGNGVPADRAPAPVAGTPAPTLPAPAIQAAHAGTRRYARLWETGADPIRPFG